YLQRGCLFRRLDETAGIGHGGGVGVMQRWLVRFAALARPEAGALGVRDAGVEGDVFRPRPAGAAGGPAIHAGGLYRVIKAAVGGGIAGDNAGPARVRLDGVGGRRSGVGGVLAGSGVHVRSSWRAGLGQAVRINVGTPCDGRYPVLAIEFARYSNRNAPQPV